MLSCRLCSGIQKSCSFSFANLYIQELSTPSPRNSSAKSCLNRIFLDCYLPFSCTFQFCMMIWHVGLVGIFLTDLNRILVIQNKEFLVLIILLLLSFSFIQQQSLSLYILSHPYFWRYLCQFVHHRSL
jgi:hypothetical protein